MSRIFTAGNYFHLADASVLSLPIGPPGLTFAVWAKFDVIGTVVRRGFWLYEDLETTRDTKYIARAIDDRSVWTQCIDATTGVVRTTPFQVTSPPFPDGEWFPLVVSIRAEDNYAARVVHPYLDAPIKINGANCYVGGVVAPELYFGSDSQYSIVGRMAHFTIYGRGLTDDEIAGFMAGAHPLNIPDAIHYWPMTLGTGDVTDTVNGVVVPMVGSVGQDAADNPPVSAPGAPDVPDLQLSLVPAIDGNQRISDPLGVLVVPPPVDSVNISEIGSHYLVVDWTYSGTTHERFTTQYKVADDWIDGGVVDADARTWTQYGLTPDTEVTIRVMATNDIGNSSPVDVVQMTGPPNTETNLDQIYIYTNLGDVPVGVRWDDYVPFNTSVTFGSDDVEALTAGRVCSNDIRAGTDGYGRWGFTHENPAFSAREGDEIWFRVYYLMPVGYDHYATNDMLKWFRQGCAQIDGGFNTGTNGISFDIKQYSRWTSYKEQPTDGLPFWQPMATFDQSTLYDDGKWHCYESYVKFSKDPAIGRQRFWVDGVLMGDVPRASLTDPEENGTAAKGPYHCNRLYFQTWWNQDSDRDRVAYFDNIAIAMNISAPGYPVRNDKPWLQVDENGFPFIGDKIQ